VSGKGRQHGSTRPHDSGHQFLGGQEFVSDCAVPTFARRGVRVAPFKAQNMSNNAAVCADGAEIGRSTGRPGRRRGYRSRAEMNPILLKPEGGSRTQVIAMGRPRRTVAARSMGSTRTSCGPWSPLRSTVCEPCTIWW
jgi:adenosylcobyric acid synthase